MRLCLIVFLVTIWGCEGATENPSSVFCSAYTECAAVSRLEERLCLGNSRLRPFWLPEGRDTNNCHNKLKTDYQQLEQLESDLDTLFTNCLLEKTSHANSEVCTPSILQSSSHFSIGRTISYVPTHCFTGVQRRTIRQCGQLKECCSAVERCESILTDSPTFNMLKEAAVQMRKRAKDCEKGLSLPPLPQYRSTITSGVSVNTLTPSGTITVRVSDKQSKENGQKQQNRGRGSGETLVSGATVTSNPIEMKGNIGVVSRPTGADRISQVIFDRLDGHEKQVQSMLEKENGGSLIIHTPYDIKQPKLSFPGGGKGSISSASMSGESTDQKESEADFGIAIEHTSNDNESLSIGTHKTNLTKAPEVIGITVSPNVGKVISLKEMERAQKEKMQRKEKNNERVNNRRKIEKENKLGNNTVILSSLAENITLEGDIPQPSDLLTAIVLMESAADLKETNETTNYTSGGITTRSIMVDTVQKKLGRAIRILTSKEAEERVSEKGRDTEKERSRGETRAGYVKTVKELKDTVENTINKKERIGYTSPSKDSEEASRTRSELSIDEHKLQYAIAKDKLDRAKDSVETQKIVDEALTSLFKASEVSKNTGGMGLASEKAREQSEGEFEDDIVPGLTVTSSPMIFVNHSKSDSNGNKNRNGTTKGCGVKKIHASKTVKMEKILTLLGEDSSSEDMKDIKARLDNWQHSVRSTLVDAKKKNKDKAIGEALDKLISHFDAVNVGLIRANVNGTWEDEDYPDGDAEIAGTICDPLENEEFKGNKLEGLEEIEGSGTSGDEEQDFSTTVQTLRETENGDKIVMDGGIEKIVISDENLQIQEKGSEEVKDIDGSENSKWREEYKKELAKNKEARKNTALQEHGGHNETTCDQYMRCRNQMHLALDGCAWRFASVKVLLTLAESPESLLFRGDNLCEPSDRPFYEDLFETLIKRNKNIRNCLEDKNKKLFEQSICVPYSTEQSSVYNAAMMRVMEADYEKSSQCFEDANLIQEKCSKLRDCCPHFDTCRETTLDIGVEQSIISKTAQINERKQECLKRKARDDFKTTLRDLLGKGSWKTIEMIRNGELGSTIGGFDRLRSRKVYTV